MKWTVNEENTHQKIKFKDKSISLCEFPAVVNEPDSFW